MSPGVSFQGSSVTMATPADSVQVRRAKAANKCEENTASRNIKYITSERKKCLDHIKQEKEKLNPSLRRLKGESKPEVNSDGRKWIPLSKAGSLPSLCSSRPTGDETGHSDSGSVSVYSESRQIKHSLHAPSPAISSLCSPRLTRRQRVNGLRCSPPDKSPKSSHTSLIDAQVLFDSTEGKIEQNRELSKKTSVYGTEANKTHRLDGVKTAWSKSSISSTSLNNPVELPSFNFTVHKSPPDHHRETRGLSPKAKRRDISRSPRIPPVSLDTGGTRLIDNDINPVMSTITSSRSTTNPGSCVNWNVTSSRLRALRLDRQVSNRLRLSDLDLTYGSRSLPEDGTDLGEELKKLKNCRYLRTRRCSSDESIYKLKLEDHD